MTISDKRVQHILKHKTPNWIVFYNVLTESYLSLYGSDGIVWIDNMNDELYRPYIQPIGDVIGLDDRVVNILRRAEETFAANVMCVPIAIVVDDGKQTMIPYHLEAFKWQGD